MDSLLLFVGRRVAHFKKWWKSPASRHDRVFGALVGVFGGFWAGVLVVVVLASPPISLGAVGLAALGCAVVGLTLGVLYPKGATLVLFPLSIFGIGSGS